MKKMKAIKVNAYGGPEVLEFAEFDKPQIKPHQILVEVKSSSVTRADTLMRQGTPFYGRFFLGFTKPKVPISGTGYAGIVTELGDEVTEFKVGDEVFGESGTLFSANAEFIAIDAEGLVMHKPNEMDFDQACSLCDGALTSFNFLDRLGKVQVGQRILINGAAGSLGSAAVQIAKAKGLHVTGVCSRKNVEFVLRLGADECIDYQTQDFSANLNAYDVIFDTVGTSSFVHSKRALSEKGIYLSPVLSFRLLWQMMRSKNSKTQKVYFDATGLRKVEELKPMVKELLNLVSSNKLKIEISRSFALHQIKEAHQLVDSGHKRGSVVLNP